MSPLPNPGRPVSLIEHDTRLPVEAVLRRNLTATELEAAERSWHPVRASLAARQRRAGRRGIAEHAHWDWAHEGKISAVAEGHSIAIGVECEGLWQGLMAVIAGPRPSRSRLPLAGRLWRRPVLYVDYLESAPWNNPELTHPDTPRFGGVGTQLLMDAVRLSIEMGLDGRVGLHSLPQAVEFYLRRGLRLLIRSDRGYHGLPYLEYTALRARAELARYE